MKLDPLHLVHLNEILKQGSFTLAAKRLGMTQPALSRTIRMLEERVGERVIHRKKGGLRPTNLGARLAAYGQVIDAENRRAQKYLARVVDGIEGEIRIGVAPLISSHMLPRLLVNFTRNGPLLSTYVWEAPMPELIGMMGAGEFDFVLGFVRAMDRSLDLSMDTLVKDQLALIAAPDHLLAGGQVSAEDLRSARWALPYRGSLLRDRAEETMLAVGVNDLHVIHESNSSPFLLEITRRTDCLTLFPRALIAAMLESKTLCELDFKHPSLTFHIGLIHRGVDLLSPLQCEFRRQVLAGVEPINGAR